MISESDTPYPRSQSIQGLSDSTSIEWMREGAARIETRDSTDFFSALGYVHAMNRGWTIAFWRQTALGNLSPWFGTKVTSLDRHARRLGLARQAQRAYDALPTAEKRRLRAYARGVSAAFQSTTVRDDDPFLVLDIQPRDWAPWHTLLIERLAAWMATPLASPPAEAPRAVREFFEVDRQFRRWLQLHGWQRSVAWAVESDSSTASPVLFQRHVLGATATSTIQEIKWSQARTPRLTAASFPGTLLFPTGQTDEKAWASLLRSPASLHRAFVDPSRVQQRTERIEPTGGDEQLLHIRWQDNALLLARSKGLFFPLSNSNPVRVQPVHWVLQWPGLGPTTDISAWLRRAGFNSTPQEQRPFSLFEGDGLRISESGRWSVLGTPSVIERDPTGSMVLVGQSPWARHQARALEALRRDNKPPAVGKLSSSDSSAWAASILSQFDGALDSVAQTRSRLADATTYVRNWDHRYSAKSIGATVFDQWMRNYRSDVGHVPTVADTSTFFASYRTQRALLRAVDTLTYKLGDDVRRWRWDRIVSDRRYFPMWSADSLINQDLEALRTTRYAPIQRSAQGHPSVVGGGPSLVAPPHLGHAPTRWTGWLGAQRPLTVRRHHFDPTVTFARSSLLRAQPSPTTPFSGSAAHTTTLTPPAP